MALTKYTQADFDALKRGEDGYIHVPKGSWSGVDFGSANKLRIAAGSFLGSYCELGNWCELGNGCELGGGCKLGDGYTCVADRHLDVLIGYAVNSECSICMRRGEEVKRCALRGVLRSVSDLVADARRGECGYAGKRWEAGV